MRSCGNRHLRGTFYFTHDHLGSTTALTDAAGNVVERMSYDAFGDTPASPRTRYTFTGRERDEFTGLYYYRARWYDAVVGRFISEDPIGFDGGVNWFAYVENNPVNRKDPSGLVQMPFLGLLNMLAQPRESDCDDCSRDVRLIHDTFDATVNNMTANRERNPFFPLNGIQGTYAELTGDTPYLSCVGQSCALKPALEANHYDNQWSFDFEESTIPFTNWHPHTWIRANSSNPRCPSIKLDPWKGTIGDPIILL